MNCGIKCKGCENKRAYVASLYVDSKVLVQRVRAVHIFEHALQFRCELTTTLRLRTPYTHTPDESYNAKMSHHI